MAPMTTGNDERTTREPGSNGRRRDDGARELVETMRRVYTPEPLSSVARARLRQGVQARLERRRRLWVLPATVATAMAVAVTLWLVWPGSGVTPVVAPKAGQVGDRWAEAVLLYDESEVALDDDDVAALDTDDSSDDELPQDYEVLAMLVNGDGDGG